MAFAMIPQPLAIFSPSGFSHFSNAVAKKKRRKLQAGTSAYEAKKEKEMAMIEFKEMEFLKECFTVLEAVEDDCVNS
ncbi:hypothetical protein Tco_0542598 [Tanacetum coccineum]